MRCLILLAQQHVEFRKQELESLAQVFDLTVDLSGHSLTSPFLQVEVEDEVKARKWIGRSVLSKAIYEILAEAPTLPEVHAACKNNTSLDRFENVSFKFEVLSYQGSRSHDEQLQIMESFDFLPFNGPVRLKSPDVKFTIMEDFEELAAAPRHQYFLRHICDSGRHLADVYKLPKRPHIGTTSFDAELALVTCNIAQVVKGDWVYDPFSGTGSFPVAGAAYGAVVIGSDIDTRPLKSYNKNFKQYKTELQFLDALGMDFTHNTLRSDLKLDAIISDPPYGVREGLRVCGSKKRNDFENFEPVIINGEIAHLRRDYIIPKKPYEFTDLMNDLLEFAAQRLTPGRRLAFWMPVASDDLEKFGKHEDLEYMFSCPQRFNKWTRYLMVYQRRPLGEKGPSEPFRQASNFREQFFNSFKDSPES